MEDEPRKTGTIIVTKEMMFAGADAWLAWENDDDASPTDLAVAVFERMMDVHQRQMEAGLA